MVDVVSKYSVHYPLIKFTCKKLEDKRTDVTTHAVPRPAALTDPGDSQEDLKQEDLINLMNQVRSDILRRHYGQGQISKETVLIFKYWDVLQMGVNLIMTKPNTVQAKKNVFLLFVNNRLVESDKIRKVVDNAYAMYQPKGGYSYLVYMALSVRPDLIDVNVHPTKKQVIIERQDDLCELLGELIDFNFTQQTASRQMQV